MKKKQKHRPLTCPRAPVFGAFFCLFFFTANPAWADPSLVDRLLSLLSTKNLPKIEIPAPAAPAQKQGEDKGEAGHLEIAPSFLPIYAAGEDPENIPPVLPFFASAPVIKAQPQVRTLLIMLPDGDREAAKAYAYAKSAKDEAGARMPELGAADTYVFVPQFLRPEDIAAQSKKWPDGGKALLRWVGDSWVMGGDSTEQEGIVSPRQHISSYAVLDFALLLLARPRLLPNLQKVVIAGTGMGGAFVQRYSVFGIAPDILSGEGMEVRFVPAQVPSYLYLDTYRAAAKSRNSNMDGQEEAPEFKPVDVAACPPANTYPYGLEKPPAYAARQGLNELRLRYSVRQVVLLAGAGATLPLTDTTPDACATTAQGENIAARAKNYFAALTRLYGDELERSQKLYLVKNINEDGLALWRSRCGLSALFGNGGCAPDDTGGKALRVLE